MKKIITIALALVMVFALAAPAAALVADNQLSTTNSSSRFSLSLQLASAMPSAGTTLYIPEIPANKAWVANEILYFVGQVTAFKDYVNPSTGLLVNGAGGVIGNNTVAGEEAEMILTGSGVSIYNQQGTISWMAYNTLLNNAYVAGWQLHNATGTGGQWTSNYTDNSITLNAAGVNTMAIQNAQNTNYMFYGYGFVTGAVAQPSIKAEIKMTSMVTDSTYLGTNNNYVLQRVGNKEYVVAYCSAGAKVAGGTRIGVKFTMDNNTNKCVDIAIGHYSLSGSDWVLDTTQGINGWQSVTKGDWYDGSNYIPGTWLYRAGSNANVSGDALTALNNVFSFMGFDYALLNTNAVLAKDFIAKINSVNIAQTATATLYSGTPPITDPPTGTTPIVPPKTGDSASILGFVMIGMAILAAAGVAYRKVRA